MLCTMYYQLYRSDFFSDSFFLQEVTVQLKKRNLLGFVFNVYIKLISYSDFTCATDDFQKSCKKVIFENCIKNLSFEKNQMFDV